MKEIYLFLVLFLFASPSVKALTLEEVIQKHTQAIGGAAAIEAVKSIEIALTIQEGTSTIDGLYRASRSGRMRMDIYADGKRVFTEAFDGQRGWQQKGENASAEDASEQGAVKLKRSVILPGKLYGLHEMQTLGHHLKLKSQETIDGINYCVVHLALSDGEGIDYYINPQNWLIDRTRNVSALHVDVDPTKKRMETRLSDYRKADGTLRAYKFDEVELDTGKIVQSGTIKYIKTNPVLEDSIFNKPLH